MRRLADERGFTLIEVLVSASLMLLVMGATMTLLSASSRQHRLVEQQADAEQTVRISLDRVSRDLRNLASPTDLSAAAVVAGAGTLPRSVERDLSYDLIFRAVDDTKPAGSLNVTNVKRVRYCLEATNPQKGVLWQQTQTWTTALAPAMPTDTACPGTGWSPAQDHIMATGVVNRADGLNRPVFRYAGNVGTIMGTDDDSRADVYRLRTDLYVDADHLRSPRAAHLATALFLRNQNREPLASLSIIGINTTTRLIDLNGTASVDPEGQLLEYQLYFDPPSPLPDCKQAAPDASCILPASGRLQFVAPAAGTHTYVLKVSDPSGLVATTVKQFTYPPPTS